MRGTKHPKARLTAIGTNQLFAEIKELVFAAEDGDQRARFLFCINVMLSHALLRGSRRFNLRDAAGMHPALRRKAKNVLKSAQRIIARAVETDRQHDALLVQFFEWTCGQLANEYRRAKFIRPA